MHNEIFQTDVFGRSADLYFKFAGFDDPFILPGTVKGKGVTVERDAHGLFLPGFEEYFGKPFQFFFRAFDTALDIFDIYLDHFRPFDFPGVLDIHVYGKCAVR